LSKSIHINDRTLRLQLWDTAGQERFRSLIPSYIRDSSVAIVVYDITNRKSFENVQKWHDDVRAERGNEVIVFLVGNKTDLADKRQVSTEEGEAKASALRALFIETSALLGLNIEEMFKKLGEVLPGIKTPAVGAKTDETSSVSADKESKSVAVKLSSTEPTKTESAGCGC